MKLKHVETKTYTVFKIICTWKCKYVAYNIKQCEELFISHFGIQLASLFFFGTDEYAPLLFLKADSRGKESFVCSLQHIFNHLVCVTLTSRDMNQLETIDFNVSDKWICGDWVTQWIPGFRGHIAEAQSMCRVTHDTRISDSKTQCHLARKCSPVITEHPAALGGHLQSWWHNHISPVIMGDYQSHLVSWRIPDNCSTHMLSPSRLLQRCSPSHRLIFPSERAASTF